MSHHTCAHDCHVLQQRIACLWERVMSRTNINESCPISKWVITHMHTIVLCCNTISLVCKNQVTYANKSCYTCTKSWYGVALVSRIDWIIPFCKRALQKRLYSAEETCNLIDPTHRSHPIYTHTIVFCSYTTSPVCENGSYHRCNWTCYTCK